MKAILVSLDTIWDRSRRTGALKDQREQIRKSAVPGSVQCLQEFSQEYTIVYLGTRPAFTVSYTETWLKAMGFPKGIVQLAEPQKEQTLIQDLKEKFDFVAGIGSRWEDNVYHTDIGCFSIILKEFEGNWDTVSEKITAYERDSKIKENETHLKGKVQGLARVLPLLHSEYGDKMWEIYYEGTFEAFENSREERKKEELESLKENEFSPDDLRDIAQWYILLNEDWNTNPNYGLQDWEIVNATESRCIIKVTRCRYAEHWKECGRPDIGYQIHCRPDETWMDRPAWNPKVRFEHPKTLMQGDDYCLFIQYLSDKE